MYKFNIKHLHNVQTNDNIILSNIAKEEEHKMTAKRQATKTMQFEMEQAFALWKKQSELGKPYFTGKGLVGFYNTMKKNPKEPDLRIYKVDNEGKASKEAYLSMWMQLSKDGKRKYLTGKLYGRKVVGFINITANEENNRPYLSVYYSADVEGKKEEVKEPLQLQEDDLPF